MSCRMKRIVLGAVAVVFLLAVSTLARGQEINLVTNGSFESPVVSTYQYEPPSSSWYYATGPGIGGGDGIATANGIPSFGFTGAIPDGNQFCFLQGLGANVSEPVTFPVSGTYELNYFAGGRTSYEDLLGGDTDYGLYLDSTPLADGTTTSNSPFSEYGPIYFFAPAGTQTLEILVTSTPSGESADQTALFDAVSITPTPEPSTLALLGTGTLGLLGYGLRRRRLAKRAAKQTAFYQPEDDARAILSLPSCWTEPVRRAA